MPIGSTVSTDTTVLNNLSQGSTIGLLGPCVFISSEYQVRTFQSFNRTSSYRYVDHEVINQKQVSEFTGTDLDEIELSMMFCGDLGVNPTTEVEKLREAAMRGEPVALLIGGMVFGKWTIRTIPEDWQFLYTDGSPQVMTIQISIKEFVDSVPTTAQSKQAQVQSRRNETGKGGPERLPGDKSTQNRELTSRYDNWESN